ncbi:hypothetical protein K493DRAFT_250082, partial [Basidiobolus meristosporus CBS 931.73]
YRSYSGNKARYINEQFIELFDMDLVTLPAELPEWFVEQYKLLVRGPSTSAEYGMRC